MNETRLRRSSGRELGSERPDDPRDDWLGDVSDDDWDEGASVPAQSTPSAPREVWVHEDVPASSRAARTAEADRSDFTRRRVVAGLALVVVAALAGVLAFFVFGGDDQASATTPVTQPVTSPTTTETTPQTTPSTTPTTPTTTTPTTTQPETGGATGFTLPEGTKLQRDAENDAAVVRELQQALTAAGYDPGPADGTYGEQTEAAVVAFQEANGLAVDGRVGPETAAALNSALATG
jgi:murein L,D-transpeptidase YcbB/YkuD